MVTGRPSSLFRGIIPLLAVASLLASALLAGLISPQAVMAEAPAVEWIRQFGTASDDYAPGVSVDSSGVYVASRAGDDAFICKYDANGSQVWTRQTSHTTDLDGYASAVSTYSGGVYVTGEAYALGSGDGPFGFVRKYDIAGNKVWTDPLIGIHDRTMCSSVSSDSSGTYVVGYARYGEAFVRRYDDDGTELWTTLYDTALNDYARGVSAYSGSINVAGDTAGEAEAFIRNYDSDGNEIWTRLPGFAETTLINGISVDSGGIYLAGEAHEPAGAQGDAFVRKYDFNGGQVWTHQFGSLSNDSASAICASSSGIYVAGHTEGALTGQTSQGGVDGFLRKYDVNGNEVWTYQFGSSADDTVTSISADATGIYVSGNTAGALPGKSNLG